MEVGNVPMTMVVTRDTKDSWDYVFWISKNRQEENCVRKEKKKKKLDLKNAKKKLVSSIFLLCLT